jgi:hypothetical protein
VFVLAGEKSLNKLEQLASRLQIEFDKVTVELTNDRATTMRLKADPSSPGSDIAVLKPGEMTSLTASQRQLAELKTAQNFHVFDAGLKVD